MSETTDRLALHLSCGCYSTRDQDIVRNGTIKIGDLSFEEVEKFKYLGATVTNINDTREEIKRRINKGNACYYSVEKLLSSSLLSKHLNVRIYKTVILPVVLYGCETWTLTLREKQRLRLFENKVLRKIFGAKRDEVTGEWRKLHNAELHTLYSSPDIIRNIKSRRLRWAGHVARMGESRNAYRVLVGRPEGKIPLGRPRRRWEDNIKMDLKEVAYDGRDCINLAQDRDRWRAYVRAAMNLRIRNFKIVNSIESEVETTINQSVAYSLALDESTDRNDKAHLAIFIRGVNEHFTVSECLLDVITKYKWRRYFPGTERHHRIEEVEFAMACVNSNRRGSSFINDAETDQEEEKELIGSLAEKKLPTEGCTGRNGEREKSSEQKKISDDRRH
ncbi:hypothetical protein ANN_23928 [Periplaneta americana]|uniref:Uncharacterized protein n=1 Tax=Periplaneta americana TaxID=6978 RepID=A0ABQ8S1P4_PERAM|nr:hypothetical protein ANN_23928 [Periplaneta americana]